MRPLCRPAVDCFDALSRCIRKHKSPAVRVVIVLLAAHITKTSLRKIRIKYNFNFIEIFNLTILLILERVPQPSENFHRCVDDVVGDEDY